MRPVIALYVSLVVAACVATTAGAAPGDWVTPADFGARGDGIADDTAALQAALDSGRPVFVPRGDYRVRMNQLSLPDGTHLSGEGTLSRIFSTEASEA